MTKAQESLITLDSYIHWAFPIDSPEPEDGVAFTALCGALSAHGAHEFAAENRIKPDCLDCVARLGRRR